MANQEMTRSGGLVQNLSGELAYFSFKPSPLRDFRKDTQPQFVPLDVHQKGGFGFFPNRRNAVHP